MSSPNAPLHVTANEAVYRIAAANPPPLLDPVGAVGTRLALEHLAFHQRRDSRRRWQLLPARTIASIEPDPPELIFTGIQPTVQQPVEQGMPVRERFRTCIEPSQPHLDLAPSFLQPWHPRPAALCRVSAVGPSRRHIRHHPANRQGIACDGFAMGIHALDAHAGD